MSLDGIRIPCMIFMQGIFYFELFLYLRNKSLNSNGCTICTPVAMTSAK